MESLPRGPLVIGWKEYVDFVAWGIRRVKVKIDTGARTSALDVASYDLREVDGQGLVAELRLALHRRQPKRLTTVRAPVLAMVVISNSGGIREPLQYCLATFGLAPVRLFEPLPFSAALVRIENVGARVAPEA